MKIRPLADRVVIKKIEAEEKTASGIVDGKEVVMELRVNDKVIFQKYAGTEVKIEGQEYTILRQSDILAVIE